MKFLNSVVVWTAIGLPATAFAQSPNPAGPTYVGLELGSGKVNFSCPTDTECSRVDVGGVLRGGFRLDLAWSVEMAYTRVNADWSLLGYDYSAELKGFGVGVARTVPLSNNLVVVARAGGAANELKVQPAVGLFERNPGSTTTQSFKPYVGMALAWQFTRSWSTSVHADWTRADLADGADNTKQTVTVRSLGAGLAFSF